MYKNIYGTGVVLGVVLGKKFRNLLGGHFGWQNGSILLCLWLYQQARKGSTAGFLGFLDLRPKNVSCTRLADTNHALTSYEMGTTNPTVFVRSPIFPLNSCYPLGLKLCISRKAIELHTNLPLPVGTTISQSSQPFGRKMSEIWCDKEWGIIGMLMSRLRLSLN